MSTDFPKEKASTLPSTPNADVIAALVTQFMKTEK